MDSYLYIMKRSFTEALAWILAATGFLVLIVAGFKFISLTQLASSGHIDAELTGGIGSFIGGVVGVLFSLSAVVFFVVALYSQKEELTLQRQELAETRSIFKQQQFESIFFNLLSIQQKIREQIQKESVNNFAFFYKNLGDRLDTLTVRAFEAEFAKYQHENKAAIIPPDNIQQFVWSRWEIKFDEMKLNPQQVVYLSFFDEYDELIGYYFNNLYFILKFLKDYDVEQMRNKSGIAKINCLDYANFVKAPMSRPELYLLGQHSAALPKVKALTDYLKWEENFEGDSSIMY